MSEQQFSQGAQGATIEQITALVEQRVRAAIEEGSRRVSPEAAEALGVWNLYAYGPIQAPAPGGPLLPHRIIKVGETFYIATVVWFNSLPAGGFANPCSMITNLGCEIVLDYCAGDLCRWAQAPAAYRPASVRIPLVPDQCWYVDVQRFTAAPGTEGLYEMNIMGRVTGCAPGAKPPLAGFVTAVYNLDADTFYPAGGPPGSPAGWRYDTPIRFQIYS